MLIYKKMTSLQQAYHVGSSIPGLSKMSGGMSKKQKKALASHTKKMKKAFDKYAKLAKKVKKMRGGVDEDSAMVDPNATVKPDSASTAVAVAPAVPSDSSDDDDNELFNKDKEEYLENSLSDQQQLQQQQQQQQSQQQQQQQSQQQLQQGEDPPDSNIIGGRRRGLFKKGSKAARDFMAMLRAKRGKTHRRSRRHY
jgi:hypothetical protein